MKNLMCLLACLFFYTHQSSWSSFRAPDVSSQLSVLSQKTVIPAAQDKNGWGGSKGAAEQCKSLAFGLKKAKKENLEQAGAKPWSWAVQGGGAVHPGVLYFKKRFWSSLLLEELLRVKWVMKKPSNSESCSKLGVTATSLFFTGKTLPEEEACF